MSAHNLEDVKVGDAVAINGSGWGAQVPQKATVTKTTKNQVVLSDGSRWLRRGRRVGASTWTREWAKPWDEAEFIEAAKERAEVQRKNKVCAFFRDQRSAGLTPEEWRQVEAICDAAAARQS